MEAKDDPKPQPPAEPGPDDCCHSGCTWCVLDLYYEDLERYRSALAAWEARQVASRGQVWQTDICVTAQGAVTQMSVCQT